jgi:hypothetical protein
MKKTARSIEFVKDEYLYLCLIVNKLLKNRDMYPERYTDEHSRALEILDEHLNQNGETAFKMRRRERRFLQKFVGKQIENLEKITIPGYAERMARSKANKEKYTPYRERAKETKGMLQSILDKVETGL